MSVVRVLLAAVVMAGLLLAQVAAVPAIWFEDVRHSPAVSQEAARSVAAHIRHRLLSPKDPDGAPLLPASVKDDFYPRLVFLSVSDGVLPARVVVGSARGLVKAADDAVAKMLAATDAPADPAAPAAPATPPAAPGSAPGDAAFNAQAFSPRWIKIDIPATILHQDKTDLRDVLEYERSLFGLAFARQGGIALLPEELVASNGVDGDQLLHPVRIRDYLAGRKPVVTADHLELDAKDATIFRFTTHGFFADRDGLHALSRGHRMRAHLAKSELRSAIDAAAGHLARGISEQGQFTYHQLPQQRVVINEYDMMHHLLAVEALAAAHGITKDPQLISAGKRAMEFAELSMGQWTREGDERRLPAMVDQGHMKLGQTGAAAMAYAALARATGEKTHRERARAFGHALLAAQRVDGGFMQLMRFPDGGPVVFDHPDYEGNAILGLLAVHEMVHEMDKEAEVGPWLEGAKRGASYLALVRDKGVPTSQLAQDHRQLLALARLHPHHRQAWVADHAGRLADRLLRDQERSPTFTDWHGGFGSPPVTGPTAQRAIALLAASRLPGGSGDERRDEQRAGEAIAELEGALAAVAFNLQCQFRPENVMYFSDPQRVLGAVGAGLTHPAVRVDRVTDHLMSMILLWEWMERWKVERFAIPEAE